jgi:hypothetical protein
LNALAGGDELSGVLDVVARIDVDFNRRTTPSHDGVGSSNPTSNGCRWTAHDNPVSRVTEPKRMKIVYRDSELVDDDDQREVASLDLLARDSAHDSSSDLSTANVSKRVSMPAWSSSAAAAAA